MQPKDFSKKRYHVIPGEDYENGPISEHGTFGNMLKNKLRTAKNSFVQYSSEWAGKLQGWSPDQIEEIKKGNIFKDAGGMWITSDGNEVTPGGSRLDTISTLSENFEPGTTLLGSKYAKLMGQGELDKLITARKRQADGDNIQDIEKDTGMLFSQGRMKYPVRDFNDRVSLNGIKEGQSYKLSDVYKKKDKDEVFIAYPKLKNITMRIHDEKGGSYAPDIKKIYTSRDKGVLAHEGMHGIQSTYNIPGKGSDPAIEALDNDDISDIISLKYGIDKDQLFNALGDSSNSYGALRAMGREYNIPLDDINPLNRYLADAGEVEANLAMEVSPIVSYIEDGVRNSKPKFTGYKSIDDGVKFRDEINSYLVNGWGELYD